MVFEQVLHKQLYKYCRRLDVGNFGFKEMDCTICVVKTKALISCAVTAQLHLIFAFGLAYGNCLVSDALAQLKVMLLCF